VICSSTRIVAIAAAAVVSSIAHAGLVTVYLSSASGVDSSTVSYGAAYQGSMQWSYTSGSTATITVNLTNTSSVTSYLAAFVVGMADAGFVVTQTSAPTNFNQITGNGLKAAPFGDYDWGSGSTSSFNGGGSGNGGLAKGQSGTWTFSVSGAAASLAAVNSAAVFNGANEWDFVAHIKGITSGSSTVSEKITSTLSGAVLPAPAALGVLAIAGIMPRRRRG
jgi:hypothetical protein